MRYVYGALNVNADKYSHTSRLSTCASSLSLALCFGNDIYYTGSIMGRPWLSQLAHWKGTHMLYWDQSRYCSCNVLSAHYTNFRHTVRLKWPIWPCRNIDCSVCAPCTRVSPSGGTIGDNVVLDDAQSPGSMTFDKTDPPSTYLGRSSAGWSLVRLQLEYEL